MGLPTVVSSGRAAAAHGAVEPSLSAAGTVEGPSRVPLFLFSHPPTLLESWGNRSLAPRVLIAARSWLSFGAATLPWLDGAVAEGVAPQPSALPSQLS